MVKKVDAVSTRAKNPLRLGKRILVPTKSVIEMNGGLPMTKYIRIDYVVKRDVALDELKGAIAEFVAGIRAHHPEHRYTSYQHSSDPLRLFILASS